MSFVPSSYSTSQHRADAGLRAVVVAVAIPGDMPAVPAVGEHGAPGVFTLPASRPYVVSPVIHSLAVIGPARGEAVLVDELAVDRQVGPTERRQIDGRPLDRFVEREITSQIAGGRGGLAVDGQFSPGTLAVGGDHADRRSGVERHRAPVTLRHGACATPRR